MPFLIVKRLVGSELILFKSLLARKTDFGLKDTTDQKAISPTTEMMRRRFPAMPEGWPGTRLDLNVFGPGHEGARLFEDRSLGRQGQADNWRIEGDIDDGEDSPYAVMEVGDFAVINFHGDPLPTGIDIYMVSQMVDEDVRLHRALERLRKRLATGRQAGYGILPEELLAELAPDDVAQDHPLMRLLLDAGAEPLKKTAAGGDPRSQAHLNRGGRRMTKEEFAELKALWEENGRKGEELVDRWLAARKAANEIRDYTWVAKEEPGSPFDFVVVPKRGKPRRYEVKTTSLAFETDFIISFGEVEAAAGHEEPYDLVRVYRVGSVNPALKVARLVNKDMAAIAGIGLPDGVRAVSFSVSPGLLDFGEEVPLARFLPAVA